MHPAPSTEQPCVYGTMSPEAPRIHNMLKCVFQVHCADIGNPAKPMALSLTFAARITCEFLAQGAQSDRPCSTFRIAAQPACLYGCHT